MKDNSKRKERNVEKFSPKTSKNRDQPTFRIGGHFDHVHVRCTVLTLGASACVFRSAGKSQRARELKLIKHRGAAKLVSEFMKVLAGAESDRIPPKFAVLSGTG